MEARPGEKGREPLLQGYLAHKKTSASFSPELPILKQEPEQRIQARGGLHIPHQGHSGAVHKHRLPHPQLLGWLAGRGAGVRCIKRGVRSAPTLQGGLRCPIPLRTTPPWGIV